VLALRPHAGSQGCDDLGLASGHDVLSQLQAAADGQLDLLVLVGPALAGDLPRATVRAALAKVPRRIHLISHLDDTVGIPPAADGQVWLLPLCDLFEHPEAHTLTSLDRRVQRTPELPTRGVLGDARPAWQWVAELMGRARPDAAEALAWPTADALRLQIAEEHPAYEGLGSLGPERPALQWGGPRLVPAAPPALPASGPRPVPEGYTVVARRGAAAPDTIGLSARDASREGVTDGDRVVLASSVGRVEGRVEVLPIAEGHLWVAWPALGALLPGEREAEGGSLITTTTVTLTAP
jgi:anaerobic selenocysteine-containing dehydrogenase